MDATVPPAPYPVRLRGELDPDLSRGLWLVKWLLLLPHLVTLVFLWIGAIATVVFSGFAILVTAHYPRPAFDYVVGVLRWSWRVGFYGLSAFGTDRYPPWTLRPRADYPADLDVDHPARLSRGLVLVKWWLLVLPHAVVVALFTGGSWFAGKQEGAGLITVLVVIAGVTLLFTGSYPRPLFDLVLGLDRWCYRVFAYSLLLTDRYPPFRLDPGGTEPPVPHHPSPGPRPTSDAARPTEVLT